MGEEMIDKCGNGFPGCRIIDRHRHEPDGQIKYPPNLFDAHVAIVDTRLEALKLAIQTHDQVQIEFQFDRVLRSVTKMTDAMKKDRGEAQ